MLCLSDGIAESRYDNQVLDNEALRQIAAEQLEEQREANRAKTAPSARERRRNWNVESVEIKTVAGSKRVKAPGEYDTVKAQKTEL